MEEKEDITDQEVDKKDNGGIDYLYYLLFFIITIPIILIPKLYELVFNQGYFLIFLAFFIIGLVSGVLSKLLRQYLNSRENTVSNQTSLDDFS